MSPAETDSMSDFIVLNRPALAPAPELEAPLSRVESRLEALTSLRLDSGSGRTNGS